MKNDPDPLLSLRAACILIAAVLIAAIATALAYLSGQAVPAAALVGGGAFGGSVLLMHQLVGR